MTHWNLRDQIQGGLRRTGQALGLPQRLIREVMERIVTQTIPKGSSTIPRRLEPRDQHGDGRAARGGGDGTDESQGNRPEKRWSRPTASRTLRYAGCSRTIRPRARRTRTRRWRPTEIDRHFQLDDEIPEQRVASLLTQVLESPLVPKCGADPEAVGAR